MLDTAANRNHITHPAIFVVYRGEHVVEKSSFHKISIMSIRRKGKDNSGQLEHIVNIAAFAGSAINLKSQLLGRTKILIHPVASSGVAVMIGHCIPEKARGH